MKKLVKWIRAYFSMSRTEANGFLVLMLVMLLSSIGLFLYKNSPPPILEINQAQLDSLLSRVERNAIIDSINTYEEYHRKRKKYYPKKEKRTVFKAPPFEESKFKKEVLLSFDINLADTIQLKKLKGIGKILSKRIVKYRDLLGGFVNVNQLAEVYGLKDSVLIQLDTMVFVSQGFEPVKINLNEASLNDISRHPYMKRTVARAIINYKFQHGAYNTMDQLGNIQLIDSLTLTKITPYIRF